MKQSKSTKRIHRREKLAKSLIWFFAILTMITLFWIVGFILVRGFYSNNLVRYDFLDIQEDELPLDNGESVIFIAHKKLRLRDITTKGLQKLYTSPIRELNTWGEFTEQDIYCIPLGYLDESLPSMDLVKKMLLSSEGLSDWKSYTLKMNSSSEMIDYVSKNNGAIGFIPASDRHLIDNSVQIVQLRDLVARVHPSVQEFINNRGFQAISAENISKILRAEILNWKQAGGHDLTIELLLSPAIDLPEYNREADFLPKADSQDQLYYFLSNTRGAIVIDRYSENPQSDFELLPVDRREKGGNLNWSFIFEKPAGGDAGGISYFILNTLLLIMLTLLISTPIGLMAAIYLVEYAKQGPFVKVLRLGTETLAGIPSIIFGLFGRIFFVRILGLGIGFLSSTLTVTLMILPTLVRTTEEALKSVPGPLREGSLAMGATRLQTILRVVLPAATPGILTGIILAIGRVVGETAVLLYTLGSGYDLVRNLSSPARVLSLHLYLLFSEAVSFDRAFATGTVLIIMILLTNLITRKLIKKQGLYR